MNAEEREYLNMLAQQVIGAVYEVANVLGKVEWRRVVRKF